MKQVFIISMLLCTTVAIQAQTKKVLIDNDKIRITEYVSQPGQDVCGSGKHSHADHVTILLTDASVQTTLADSNKQLESYKAAKHLYIVQQNGKTENIPTDGVFWVKAATHAVVNTGNKPMHFYIIETK